MNGEYGLGSTGQRCGEDGPRGGTIRKQEAGDTCAGATWVHPVWDVPCEGQLEVRGPRP